jgi:hypothetical protein
MRNSRVMPLIFAVALGAAPYRLSASPNTGLSYSQVTRYLESYFVLQESTPVNGQRRFMGATTDKLAVLELIGDKKDISKASLILGVPNDSPAVLARNGGLLIRFVKNAMPNWPAGSDWAVAALKQASATSNPVSTIRGSRRITVSFLKPLAIVLVTVQHR